MVYRVVVKFAHKKMYGKWTSKTQAEKEEVFWRQIVRDSATVYVQSQEDVEE